MIQGEGGNRLHWDQLPAHVRTAISDAAGGEVVEARTQPGGFSPGLAARLTLANGERVFAKAATATLNADTADLHRREARTAATLPASTPAPRLLWSATLPDAWTALLFTDVDGTHPTLPWREREWTQVHQAVVTLGHLPAPPLLPPVSRCAGWQSLLEAPELARHLPPWPRENLTRLATLEQNWHEATQGLHLVHGDLRADNILITADRVVFVDWPHAGTGAPWLDLLFMLPCLALQGGPTPAEVWRTSSLTTTADPDAVTIALAGLAGMFTYNGLLPDPPGIPTVREFQRRQATEATTWLRSRLAN